MAINRTDSHQVVLEERILGRIHHMTKGIVMREEYTGMLGENIYHLVRWSFKYEVGGGSKWDWER